MWEWVPGSLGARRNFDANILGNWVTDFKREHNRRPGRLELVDAAKPINSELHQAIDWDVERAAQRDFEQQAGHLLGSLLPFRARIIETPHVSENLTIKMAESPEMPRGVIGLRPATGGSRRVYDETAAFLREPFYRKQQVAEGWKELEQWINKYKGFQEFRKVLAAIEPHIGMARAGGVFIARKNGKAEAATI